MKTIAITIEEPMLEQLDRLVDKQHGRWNSRSEAVRAAIRQFLALLEREVELQREQAILRRNRTRLARQAAALVKEQVGR